MRLWLRTFAVLALCVWPVAALRAQGNSQPSAILIFDGSGSMWGKLEAEKKTKLDQARDAVRDTLGKLNPQSVQFGLVSFGHRRASDCSDVQVMVPPEAAVAPAFTERLMAPLEKLNPRGKGPLTAALREAAKVLGKQPAPRHIVLLHDDPDNCQADPCAALGELQQAAPGVAISVIGLGLKPEDATKYQCLTQTTGGRHYNAQDGGQIAAAVSDALQRSVAGSQPMAAPRTAAGAAALEATLFAEAAAAAAVAKPIDLVRTGPPALRLRALMSSGRLPLGHLVHWAIYAGSVPDGSAPTAQADGIDAVVPIAAAAYRIRATSGLVTAEANATVGAEGQTLAELNFNAAEFRIRRPLPGDAMLIVAERNGDSAAKPGSATTPGRRLGLWPPGQTSVLVPARPLWVQLEQGELRAQWPIEVPVGQIRELDVSQAGARVQVALLPPVGPVIAGSGPFLNQPIVFTIEEDDPDAPHGRREIARSAASAPEFVVPPGVYTIAASRGTLETRERISVAAGETVRRALPLIAARLVVSARFGNAPAAPTDGRSPNSFRVTRLDTETDTAILLAGPAAIIDVPPGRYRVEARRHDAAIKAEQVVEIRAGDYLPVTLDYQAGELRMEMSQDQNADGERVGWRVIDDAGRLVWSGSDPQASTMLQAGHYTVRTTARGRLFEQGVDVGAGAVSTVRPGGRP